ncbi:MAG: type VI secretion system baseplate subunit TssG [Pseudomonadota bacterium]
MQAKKWGHESGVMQGLFDEPYRFQFVQAMRLLLVWMRQNNVTYDKALLGVLRFPNSLSLNFPASQLEAICIQAAGGTDTSLQDALQLRPLPQIRLTQAFIGFLGTSGGLPYHYSERIAALQWRTKDEGVRAFFDTFSGRMVPLFYQGWAKYRLEHQNDVLGKDMLLPLLHALGGIRRERFVARSDGRDHGGVDAVAAACYAGLLRHRPVSACVIERVLTDYLRVQVKVDQFVGAWDNIPGNRITKLGVQNSKLGYGLTLGMRCWKTSIRVRLRIGPLDKAEFERFLPGACGVRAIEKLLGMFGLTGIEFEAMLIIRADCVDRLLLSCTRQDGRKRLGWDTYLVTKPVAEVRADLRYQLHPC